MRLILSIIILFNLSIEGAAQTKEETEKWISEKFEKYKVYYLQEGSSGLSTSYIPVFLKFDSCSLILKHRISHYDGEFSTNTRTINIGDVTDFKWIDHKLYLLSRKYNVLDVTTPEKNPKERKTSYVGASIISLNTFAENNLEERLVKAFNHLKSFCNPSIDENELF